MPKKSTLAYENNILVEENDSSNQTSANNLLWKSDIRLAKPMSSPIPNVMTFVRRQTMKPYV